MSSFVCSTFAVMQRVARVHQRQLILVNFHLFHNRIFGDKWHIFTGLMPFLSPNQQYQNTREDQQYCDLMHFNLWHKKLSLGYNCKAS